MDAKAIKLLNAAIEVKMAALKRAANTETDEEIKELRKAQQAEYITLQAKLNSKELFNETQISKQK